jgi:hypothetical protein
VVLGGDDGSVPPTPSGELSLDPVAKKIRNLNKKVCLPGLSFWIVT